MDIPSFLSTYGGLGGLGAIAVGVAIQSRKFDAERRAELREDIDREQADNERLRESNTDLRANLIVERDRRVAAEKSADRLTSRVERLEAELRVLRNEGSE